MVSSHGLTQNNKHTAVTHSEQVAYVRLIKEAIQGGASSGVVEPVRGIMLCYTSPFLKNQRVPVLLYDPALL